MDRINVSKPSIGNVTLEGVVLAATAVEVAHEALDLLDERVLLAQEFEVALAVRAI
jgi:hypothetical protein